MIITNPRRVRARFHLIIGASEQPGNQSSDHRKTTRPKGKPQGRCSVGRMPG
jgi:hypothetical protein